MNNNKNKLNYSLTNIDIDRFLGSGHIIRYRDLARYSTIDQVFGDHKFVVILVESKLNSGHWVNLILYPDGTIEQFDSYNGSIDHELNFINKNIRGKLGEDDKLLTNLLKNRKTVCSKYQFQRLDPSIDTCGKHCVLRILMFLKEGLTLGEYTKWFKGMMRHLHLDGDDLVCLLIET